MTLTWCHSLPTAQQDAHDYSPSGVRVEALCDAWNAHNADELARLTGLPRAAVSPHSREWVPSSEMVELSIDAHNGGPIHPIRGKPMIGYGDKIRCGSPRSAVHIGSVVRLLDEALIPTTISDPTIPHTIENREQADQMNSFWSSEGYNVCRPFDEAHAENAAIGRPAPCSTTREYFLECSSKIRPRHMPDFVSKLVAPPNHGHGAPCECGVLIPKKPRTHSSQCPKCHGQTKWRHGVGFEHERYCWTCHFAFDPDEPIQDALRGRDPRCPHCSGTGRIICDDERAGRVSPSHAANPVRQKWLRANQPGWTIASGWEPAQSIAAMAQRFREMGDNPVDVPEVTFTDGVSAGLFGVDPRP